MASYLDTDVDLPTAMLRSLQLDISPTSNLLPVSCSQEAQTLKFLDFLEETLYGR